ncbi:MAG: anhydro-N-acetylmuramic acid kinase [Paracoccaceae bacterium]|jgi:anhydro-N-acetylmuramic acid kinase
MVHGMFDTAKRLKGKDPIWAAGTMSGTSLDGVDVALLQSDGEKITGFGETRARAYSLVEQETLRAGLGLWPGDDGVDAIAELIETAHIRVLSRIPQVDLIGFHGQTLSHDPDRGRTHQVGDGQVLSDVLGRPVLWDFRSSDMELGGQGAPLAPFFHFACAKWIGATDPVCFLNLGGVGNLTWVDPGCARAEDAGALVAFDTGPANAPLNDLVRARLGQSYDKDGVLSLAGTADPAIVAEAMLTPYFLKIPPKSLDRNDFDHVMPLVDGLKTEDAAATLVAFAAKAVARGLEHCPCPPSAIYVTGGGRSNPAMMAALRHATNANVLPVENVGLNGDFLEAQAFAYLAIRVARGLPTSGPSTTGVAAFVGGGKLSVPSGR